MLLSERQDLLNISYDVRCIYGGYFYQPQTHKGAYILHTQWMQNRRGVIIRTLALGYHNLLHAKINAFVCDQV